jgi:hypothetical protein
LAVLDSVRRRQRLWTHTTMGALEKTAIWHKHYKRETKRRSERKESKRERERERATGTFTCKER